MKIRSNSVAGKDPRQARIAILGAGLIGKKHAQLAAGCARLVAIVDPSPHTEKFAHELNVPHFDSLERLLDAEVVDGIVIATPSQLHVEHGIQCIEAGIPILVEKPIADTVVAATKLIEASENAGVPILVGHHRRYNPIVKKVKNILETGELGRIVSAHTTCWFYKPDDYFQVGWRREPGAGPIYINLIHDVDLLLHYCGEVESLQAMDSNAVRGNAIEDSAVILLRFKSGALATLTLSDTISSPWSWELTSGENQDYPKVNAASTMLGGTRGSLSVPDLSLWKHDGNPNWLNGMNKIQVETSSADPLDLQMQHFARVVSDLDEPLVPAREGLAALKVIEAIKQAANNHCLVSLA